MPSYTKPHSERLADHVRGLYPANRGDLLAAGRRELRRVAYCCRRVVRLRLLDDDPIPHVLPIDHHAAVIVTAVGATTVKDGLVCGLFRYRPTVLKSSQLTDLGRTGFSGHTDRPMPDFIR